MAYVKHNWLDEIVQYPTRYKLKDVTTGVEVSRYDLERVTGTITAQDKINAVKLNNMESGIETAHKFFSAPSLVYSYKNIGGSL